MAGFLGTNLFDGSGFLGTGLGTDLSDSLGLTTPDTNFNQELGFAGYEQYSPTDLSKGTGLGLSGNTDWMDVAKLGLGAYGMYSQL